MLTCVQSGPLHKHAGLYVQHSLYLWYFFVFQAMLYLLLLDMKAVLHSYNMAELADTAFGPSYVPPSVQSTALAQRRG